MIFQTLNVIPHGLIESGQLIFKADEKTGIIEASESIVAGVGWFTKTIAQSGSFKIDPSLLLSQNILPGMNLTIGSVQVKLLAPGKASIVYQNGSDVLNGTADLDLSGHYWEVVHINLTGTVDGESVQLELEP